MTRDEYLRVLATEPATGAQIGAIIGEFDRLGIVDRAERLSITAAILGLEKLGSTTDLVMGQAGQLVAMLRRTRDRAELSGVTAAATYDNEDQADDEPDAERITLAEAIIRIIAMIYTACRTNAGEDKSADIRPPY